MYSCQVTRKYVAVARIMKSYEDQKYAVWKEQVEATLMSYLKRNLLVKPTTTSSTKSQLLLEVEKSTSTIHNSISMQKSQGKYLFQLIYYAE